jgi:hypothetical protein
MKKGHKQYNGRVSQQLRGRREWLVASGRASFWYAYRNPEQTAMVAGLP